MKPLAIRARNFRTWRSLDLEVPEGIVAVVGPNGSGKSSLVNVLDLGLFGTGRELKRTRTRAATDEAVEVELVFEHGGEVYRVRRGYDTRGRGKPSLAFEHAVVAGFVGNDPAFGSWEPLGRETIDETQAEIENVLGLSRRTFRASSYLAQDDGSAFTTAEPRDRKAILLDALGVRTWDRLHERAGARRRDLETVLARHVAACEAAEGELEQRDALTAAHLAAVQRRDPLKMNVDDHERGLEAIRQELADAEKLEASRASRIEVASSTRRRKDEAEERARRLRAQVNGHETVDVEALRAAVALEEPATRARDLHAKREEIRAEQRRLDDLGAQAEREEEALSSRTDALVAELAAARDALTNESLCPTCKRPLEGESLEEALAVMRARVSELEREQGETMERARAVAERLEGIRTESLAVLERDQAHVREWSATMKALPSEYQANYPSAITHARRAAETLAGLEEREKALTTVRTELEEVEASLPGLTREAEEAAAQAAEMLEGPDTLTLRSRVKEAEVGLAAARETLAGGERDVTRAAAALERLDEVAKELEVQRGERAAVADKVELLRLAERVYGRDGIPALILEARALPHLEAEANRIVAELGRDYRFELRTLRETASGGAKEALDVVVYTTTGEALYEDFSGGERTRLDLALRIALARLLAARRGSDVRVLAIDEPAYLDDEGFEQLARVLLRLRREFETILVVSHVDTLRDAFDSAIIVGGGADTGEPSRLEEVR